MGERLAMSLEVEWRGDAAVVTLHGRISTLEARRLEGELLDQVERGRPKIVLDMSDVPFITSACLGALVAARMRGHKQGGYLRVACPQPLVEQVLRMTKLAKVFGLYKSVGDALTTR